MALIKLPAENTTLTEFEAVRSFLATHGIDYEKWTPEHPVDADATKTSGIRFASLMKGTGPETVLDVPRQRVVALVSAIATSQPSSASSCASRSCSRPAVPIESSRR